MVVKYNLEATKSTSRAITTRVVDLEGEETIGIVVRESILKTVSSGVYY